MTYPAVLKTVLVDKENSWGTATTNTRDLGLIQDITENLSRELIETTGLGKIETQQVFTGNVDNSSSITLLVQHGRPFEYILGTVSHTNSGTDFKHTYSVQAAAPSFTMECSEDSTTDSVMIHSGNLVEGAELSIAMNETLKLKMDLKSKTCTSTTTGRTSPVVSTLPTFPANLCTVNLAEVAATEVQNFSIKFEKKVEKAWGLQSIVPQQGHATDLRFAFNGSLGFSDTTYQDLFMGGSLIASSADPTSFVVNLTADNGTAYGSGQRKLSLTLTACHMNSFNKTASVGGLIFVEIAGKGVFNEMYQIDNLNATSAY